MVVRPLIAVRAIIRDKKNRVLFLKRNHSKFAQDKWCLPGGNINYGATAEQSLVKEVKEETDLICRNVRFVFYQDSLSTEEFDSHYIVLYFECHVKGKIRLNEESSEYRWIGRHEIDDVDIAFTDSDAVLRYWTGIGVERYF